jgi:hypothetical protein
MRLRLQALPIALLLPLGACTPKTLSQGELRSGPLNYLQEGQTTREDAILRLGVPSADFETGRILTYRIAQLADGSIAVRPRQMQAEAVPQNALLANYSLVLVFDDKGVLRKQSLVPVK